MVPEPVAVTLLVANALEKLGVPYFIGDSLAQLPEVPDQFFPRDVFGGGPNHFSTEQRAAQKRAWLLGKLPTVESTYLGDGRWRIVLPLTLLFEPAYLSWGSDGDG